MTPWQRLKHWARGVVARFGVDPRYEQRFVIPYGVAGVNLTADDTLSLAATWACIDVIARNIASCRWNIYQEMPGPKNKRQLMKDDPKTWMLNTRPNPEMTAIAFREAMLFQAIPFGNAYAEIQLDRAGRPAALWPLMSDRMWPRRNPQTWALEYHYINYDGTIVDLPAERIMHFRGPGIYSLMGDNLVARASKSLGVAAAAERFSASYFGQGASPQGVLEFPGTLDDDTHNRLRTDWAERHKGPENAHKPLILEAGMKWSTISFDPQKSQLVESRKFSVEEICRWFGVPPHKIQQLDHATFSNIEHSSIEFVRDALVPWSCRLSQEADAKLFTQVRAPWKYTEIDLRPLTHGDAISRAQAQSSWRQNGIMTGNEIRALEGLDDAGPDQDAFLVNSTLKPLEQVLEPPPPPPIPGLAPGQQPQLPAGDEDESGDAPDDAEPASESGAKSVARRAVVAGLIGVVARFERKLTNRRRATDGKPDEGLAKFRADQLTAACLEFDPFQALALEAIGRNVVRADIVRAVELYEQIGDAVDPQIFLPS